MIKGSLVLCHWNLGIFIIIIIIMYGCIMVVITGQWVGTYKYIKNVHWWIRPGTYYSHFLKYNKL